MDNSYVHGSNRVYVQEFLEIVPETEMENIQKQKKKVKWLGEEVELVARKRTADKRLIDIPANRHIYDKPQTEYRNKRIRQQNYENVKPKTINFTYTKVAKQSCEGHIKTINGREWGSH